MSSLEPSMARELKLTLLPVLRFWLVKSTSELESVGMRARLSVPLVILAAGMIPLVSSP